MKHLFAAVAAICVLGTATAAHAACYHFDKAPSDTYVCIKGDSFSDRDKAKKICTEKAGKDCGNVASYSSSCHSNIDKCYDENGKAHRDLSGY